MNVLRIIGLVIIFPVILISLFLVFTGASVRPFLHEKTYTQVLEDNDIYMYAKAEIRKIDDEFMQEIFGSMDPESMINDFLREILMYARGDTRTLELSVSLSDNMLQFFEMMEQQASMIPICKAGQSMYMYGQPVCRPSNMSISEFMSEAMGDEQGMPIPKDGKIDLVEMFDKDNYAPRVQQYIQLANRVFYGALIALVVLLVAAFFLRRMSLVAWMSYISSPLILVGLTGVIGSVLIRKMALAQIPVFEDMAFAKQTILDLANVLLGNLTLYGAIFLGLGVVLIVLSFIFKNKK